MAERVGFEPTKELPLCWFSRPVLLTAQPPLHRTYLRLYFTIFSELNYNFILKIYYAYYSNK